MERIDNGNKIVDDIFENFFFFEGDLVFEEEDVVFSEDDLWDNEVDLEDNVSNKSK